MRFPEPDALLSAIVAEILVARSVTCVMRQEEGVQAHINKKGPDVLAGPGGGESAAARGEDAAIPQRERRAAGGGDGTGGRGRLRQRSAQRPVPFWRP